MKPFILKQRTVTFSDGQELTLKEPTLLQIQNANRNSDPIEMMKSIILDMSGGDITKEQLNALPMSEFKLIQNVVSEFLGIDEKNLMRV